ncbi:DoxX family protein [Pedobacter agri]|uniref:DoxX family protein n=1 Tax=Pedobacter agri TaxID=454586 RepID=UPI00292E4F56|nr:hypothetical protein [Pedobacter agri]
MKKHTAQNIARVILGTGLIVAGIGHLTFARKEFQAQVPNWVPLKKDDTVVASGVVEIAMGASLVLAPRKYRPVVGILAASLFVAVFPGNISQYLNKRNGFGLDTDEKRLMRLFFQPVLIYWALKSTQKEVIKL